jgi:hypothetical protein
MDRNTVVRIAIPLSLYESVKGKVLNEAKKPVDAAVNEEFMGPRQKAYGMLQTLRELGISDESLLEYVLGNYMTGSDAEEAMKYAYKEFVGYDDDEDEEIDEAKKKPSAGMTKKEKSAVAKKAAAGKDIGKKGKGFAAIEKKAKESGADNPKAVAAAAMWKSQAKKK